MEAAEHIREAVERVSQLRARCGADPALAAATHAVKHFQGRRFAGTYADLLSGGTFASAARFFLVELYGDRDYTDRDAQFARIAGALQRLFPAPVVATAVALADLHALTETLDAAMAEAWRDTRGTACARYVAAWRVVGRQTEREQQLAMVLAMGQELARLTRTPGLRLMLRMMRRPAQAAGMGALQGFLETGFDTFADLAAQRDRVDLFLGLIRQRESALIASLFTGDPVASETKLDQVLGQAR